MKLTLVENRKTFFLACLTLVSIEFFAIPLIETAFNLSMTPKAFAEYGGRFGRKVNGVNRGINRRNVVRQSDIKEIPGFSNLVQLGNVLLERNRFGQLRRLFISRRTGRLSGASEGETVRQLKEFYLTNFDKFGGRNGSLVRQFLVNNGARNSLFGNLTVDLETGVMPEFKNMKNRKDVQLSALNFLINQMSQSSRLLRVQPQNVRADGTVSLNLRGAFRSASLALWTNDNPYDCGGRGTTPPRLDWLANRAMDSEVYYQMKEIPRTLEENSRKLGVQDNKRNTLGNKILIAGPNGENESLVGKDNKRTLEVQSMRNRPGGSYYISWDTRENVSPGVQKESRNPLIKGINFTHDASESIWHNNNGFLDFGLNAADGTRANNAPADIALATNTRAHLGQAVDNPVNCLICHANGFIGGGKAKGGTADKLYTDNLNKIPSFSRRFFTSNRAYFNRAQRDSRIYLNAIRRSGSFVPDDADPSKQAPILPELVEKYRENLSIEQAAKELRVPQAALAGLLGRNEGTIERAAFEASFCGLKRRLAGVSLLSSGSVLNENSGQQSRSNVSGENHNEDNAGGVQRPQAQQ